MAYIEFLGRWYNLVFLLFGVIGVAAWLAGRGGDKSWGRATGTLLGAAVTGLTINGALHDLSLGDPGARFAIVLPVSLLVGFGLAAAYAALSARYFPSVRSVQIDAEDLSGLAARVVSREVGSAPRSGRAQRQDDGVLHLVHCHTSEENIGFGCSVLLGEYDPSEASYRIERRKPDDS